MTVERIGEEDRELDRALAELPVPELPAELSRRLAAIPERGNVRRFPGRSWRVSALGWAAAAAIGLVIGAQTAESEPIETVSVDTPAVDTGSVEEDETLALAVGSFTDLEEEP
jgi:anti-sigma factor RsiW